ncbi:TolC family protein [Aquabacterium sp.]|uniref:TolC family protein n=1 Tax=Aquabacterium sp. TaxID=1872578 RepID=UPI0019BBE949|nr:TolC family protein [Aquabacterium sp.]MBC7700938.1 TolC family protein [Aquabacterium sp.]
MKKTVVAFQTLKVSLLASALTGLMWSDAALARCTDDVGVDHSKASARAAPAPKFEVEAPLDPMTQLQLIAKEAAKRSAEVGAARLLAEAAAFDLDETKGARYPQVSVSGSAGPTHTTVDGVTAAKGTQHSLSLNVSSNLYDFGRQNKLTEWRSQLAGSAKYGAAVTQEQVVLEAVSTALERNRFRLQAQVYQQYVRKMSCLVEALEGIVSEDKGRASELVQARKTQSQTELSRDAALAQSRQIEFRLRKLIGDKLSLGDGITVPLAAIPEIGEINRQIEFGNDAQQLRTQADALDSYAKAVVAGQKPQVNWALSKTEGVQGLSNKVSSWQAGVSVSYSLFNGFSDKAASSAASKRAESARQQLAELLASKFARTAEIYDIATTSMERAKRYVDVLRDSERVRNFTFQQWSQLGKRSLFDVMSAEADHFGLRIAYVNALHDGFAASAQMRSMGTGLSAWLLPEQQLQRP